MNKTLKAGMTLAVGAALAITPLFALAQDEGAQAPAATTPAAVSQSADTSQLEALGFLNQGSIGFVKIDPSEAPTPALTPDQVQRALDKVMTTDTGKGATTSLRQFAEKSGVDTSSIVGFVVMDGTVVVLYV